MRAMILAAGRGERMGALTATLPKPLLQANNRYLIEYSIQYLKDFGVTDIVINLAYQGAKIKEALGNGSRYGVHIEYSEEVERLETGGGILQALPLLGDQPFIVLSSDVVTNFPLATLPKQLTGLAHLVVVDNPSFNLKGDFGLEDGYISMQAKPTFTFANVGLYSPALFADCAPGHFPLNRLLFPAIERKQITGQYFKGDWFNIGSPQQLNEFSAFIQSTMRV